MPTKIVPLADKIVIRRKTAEERTSGGVILPDVAKEKPKEGVIMAVGSDVDGCDAGDRVIFSSYAGIDIKVEETDYLIVQVADILAVLRDSE